LLIAPHRDELSDLAGAFNDLLGQLQQAFEKQQRFAGEAAHQLRTPLTILRGEIDVALRRPRNDEEYRRVLRTLGDQTHELQQIVEILLQLARLEGEDARFDQERVDLTNWLPSQLSRWSDHPRAVDLRVHAENDLWVTTSPALLAQAIHNLLDNAVKYSPPGSPVTLAAARQAGSVILTVTDEGVGISSDERSAIFDPFYRGSFARRRGIVGTGLGLPLVARIATVLGGSATCDGRPGQGSRFTLSLPLSDDLDRPPATTQEDHLISKT
ncbi:MAG: HAMP domain-containing histidine kinase, partial [Planctomycetaceae bacterium]|nr:HAMP domain-containing histidine kinase [Planctomycetaceae bacterium]